MVAEVMKDGFLDRHVPTIRALYKAQRDAMLAALAREEMAGRRAPGTRPTAACSCGPACPQGMSAVELLPKAVDKGVAFVPGAAFYRRQRRPAHPAPELRDGQRGADQFGHSGAC
jgi:2-aminoadipate transaminase